MPAQTEMLPVRVGIALKTTATMARGRNMGNSHPPHLHRDLYD